VDLNAVWLGARRVDWGQLAYGEQLVGSLLHRASIHASDGALRREPASDLLADVGEVY